MLLSALNADLVACGFESSVVFRAETIPFQFFQSRGTSGFLAHDSREKEQHVIVSNVYL